MPIPLIETLATGGCWWPIQDRFYGHSIALPNGTAFAIALHGPRSRVTVPGECRDGWFAVLGGSCDGQRFPSAHAAVNTVREPSSNAYIHTDFRVDGRWLSADAMRGDLRHAVDRAEEIALLGIVLPEIRKQLRETGATAEEPDLLRAAARFLQQNPVFVEEARHRLAFEASLNGA